MKKANVVGQFKDLSGKTRDIYESAELMVFANGIASGIIADGYKKRDLKVVADYLKTEKVYVILEDGRRVILENGFYTVWKNGECVFSESGDPVAVMDSMGC